MNQSELKNNDNQNDQLTDLEPQNEVKGGGTGGVGAIGALVNVDGSNTPVGVTTVRTGSTFTVTFGGSLS